MDLTLEALEQALSPITEIGTEELTFTVSGTEVSLRVMSPEEEGEVQRYSAGPMPENPSADEVMSYLERFKVAVLSHAIVQIGTMNLRDVKFVETPEKLDNDKPVKVAKHLAMRGILDKWPGGMRTTVFLRYYDLLEQFERRVDAAIDYEPPDLDAEIERVEAHLKKLKEAKERKSKDAQEGFANQVKMVAEEARAGKDAKKAHRQKAVEAALGTPQPEPAPEPPQAEEPPQEAAQPATGTRQPITPASAVPPAPPEPAPPVEEPPAPQEEPVVEEPVAEEKPAAPLPPPPADDSFVDMSDPDAMQQEAARETARLMEMRRTVGKGAPTSNPSALTAVHDAVRARSAEPDPGIDAAEQIGEQDGKPVFRAPAQELTRTAHADPRSAPPVQIDAPAQMDASRNPRFKAPPKGP